MLFSWLTSVQVLRFEVEEDAVGLSCSFFGEGNLCEMMKQRCDPSHLESEGASMTHECLFSSGSGLAPSRAL